MKTTVSVITVTYDTANLLLGLIDNLRARTDPDFEWIVIDGDSTDATVEQMQWHARNTFGMGKKRLPNTFTMPSTACKDNRRYKESGIDR